MTDNLIIGFDALKSGDKAKARQLFAQVVVDDPRNAVGWLWLSYAMDDITQKRECLKRVLAISPESAEAREQLEAIDRLDGVSSIPLPAQQPPASKVQVPFPPQQLTVQQPVTSNLQTLHPAIKKEGTNWTIILLLGIVLLTFCACVVLWQFGRTLSSLPSDTLQTTYLVRYRVTGTTSRASLTYQNSEGGTEQAVVNVPWDQLFTFRRGDFAYLSAQNQQDHGSIVCEIWVNGTKWKESTSSGGYTIASCSGSVGRD